MAFINCAEGTLEAYVPSAEKPWNIQRANHLYRRIMLGANAEVTKEALDQSPQTLIKKIISDAKNLALAPEPEWAYWQLSDYDADETIRNEQLISQIYGWATQWMKDMRNNGLRERMSFFWHNHFVTKQDVYGCPSWMYQYHKVLQTHALGNFKDFVREIGITPAMLVFLNGVQNFIGNPNENYAREFYELFTLGVDNGYTQTDIVETARAFSGWNGIDVEDFCGSVEFIPFLFDPGPKTILGRTGNWGYDDVINILFEERALEISEYICEKLYIHFVNPTVDEQLIADLATIFRDNDFEIEPVLEALFCSDHFFESANFGTVIPGHVEYFLMFMNQIGYEDYEDLYQAFYFALLEYDQTIFSPTDVAGWPGNRAWINSNSLPFRTNNIFQVMALYYQLHGESLQALLDFALNIVGDEIYDVNYIVRSIIHYMLPQGLQHEYEYEEALVVFKADVPENYYEDGIWSLLWDVDGIEYPPYQVFLLLNHLAFLPEFQLK